MQILRLSQKALNRADEILRDGGVVVFPTDTVYGFLSDAGNKKAVVKIYKIKKRASGKPLPVFVKDLKMAKQLAEIGPEQEKILKKRWPGKYTFILKVKSEARSSKSETNSKFKIKNSKFLSKNGAVALRMPKYKFLLALLKKVNRPLAQTSVNISGQPSLNKISEITEIFSKSKTQPDLIIDAGTLPKRNPSSIIDLTGEVLTRLR